MVSGFQNQRRWHLPCLVAFVTTITLSSSAVFVAEAFTPIASTVGNRNHGSITQFQTFISTQSKSHAQKFRLNDIPTLDEWRLLPNGRVEGRVVEHPEIEVGATISTSPLKDPSVAQRGQSEIVVETLSGSKYQLLFPMSQTRAQIRGTRAIGGSMRFNKLSGQQLTVPSPIAAAPSGLSKKELAAAAGEVLVQTREEKEAAATARAGMSKKEMAAAEGETLVQTKEEKEASAAALNARLPFTTDVGTEQGTEESENLMEQIKDAGVAGIISYAFWELGFWTISVPICIVAYYQVTGHWPDFSDKDDVAKLGAEAFAFVNFARFAVPLRIGLALGTTPWVQANIVDPFKNGNNFDFFNGGATVPESYLDTLEKQARGRPRSGGQGNISGATSYLDALGQQEFGMYDYSPKDGIDDGKADTEGTLEEIVNEENEDLEDNDYENAPEEESTNVGDSEEDNSGVVDDVDEVEDSSNNDVGEIESQDVPEVVGFGMSYLDGLGKRGHS